MKKRRRERYARIENGPANENVFNQMKAYPAEQVTPVSNIVFCSSKNPLIFTEYIVIIVKGPV